MVTRPEHTFHKIISAFGYQDIDFGNRPTFSSKYLLRGPDEQGIRNLFIDALLGFYEMNEGTSTDGGGSQLFISGKTNGRRRMKRRRSLTGVSK